MWKRSRVSSSSPFGIVLEFLFNFSCLYFIDAVVVTTAPNRCKIDEEINKVSWLSVSWISLALSRTRTHSSGQFMRNGRFVSFSCDEDIIKSKQIKNRKVNYWCRWIEWKKGNRRHRQCVCRVFIAFIPRSLARIVLLLILHFLHHSIFSLSLSLAFIGLRPRENGVTEFACLALERIMSAQLSIIISILIDDFWHWRCKYWKLSRKRSNWQTKSKAENAECEIEEETARRPPHMHTQRRLCNHTQTHTHTSRDDINESKWKETRRKGRTNHSIWFQFNVWRLTT